MDTLSFIEASMLGDGCLRKAGKTPYYKLTQVARHKDYIDFAVSVLSRKVFTRVQYYEKRRDGRNASPWYVVETRTDKDFHSLYDRWYPHGTKIIPHDLVMDLQMLSIWVMDDGSYNKSRQEIKLSTNAFSFEDAEFLREILYRDLNIKASVRRDSDKKHPIKFPTMYILRPDTRIVCDTLTPYIMPSFQYKLNKYEN